VLFSVSVLSIPSIIDVSGRAKDSSNNVITGAHNFTFRLFNNYTGGTKLYEQNSTLTLNSDGFYYSTLYNLNQNISDTSLYLEIVFDTQIQSPRKNWSSNAYAFRANTTDYIEISAINTTTHRISNGLLDINFSFWDNLFYTKLIVDSIIGSIGNWTANQIFYNTTVQLYSIFLNQSDTTHFLKLDASNGPITGDVSIQSNDSDNNTDLSLGWGTNHNSSLTFVDLGLPYWRIFLEGLSNNLFIRDMVGDGVAPTDFMQFFIAENKIETYVNLTFKNGSKPISDWYCDAFGCYNLTDYYTKGQIDLAFTDYYTKDQIDMAFWDFTSTSDLELFYYDKVYIDDILGNISLNLTPNAFTNISNFTSETVNGGWCWYVNGMYNCSLTPPIDLIQDGKWCKGYSVESSVYGVPTPYLAVSCQYDLPVSSGDNASFNVSYTNDLYVKLNASNTGNVTLNSTLNGNGLFWDPNYGNNNDGSLIFNFKNSPQRAWNLVMPGIIFDGGGGYTAGLFMNFEHDASGSRLDLGWGGSGGGNFELYSKNNPDRPGEFRVVYGGTPTTGHVQFTHYDGTQWYVNSGVDENGSFLVGYHDYYFPGKTGSSLTSLLYPFQVYNYGQTEVFHVDRNGNVVIAGTLNGSWNGSSNYISKTEGITYQNITGNLTDDYINDDIHINSTKGSQIGNLTIGDYYNDTCSIIRMKTGTSGGLVICI
jgi:hypothetical protein